MGIFNKLFEKNNIDVYDSSELMDEDRFWQIVQSAYRIADGDYVKEQQELRKLLMKLVPTEIIYFDNRFRQLRGEAYSWEVWGAAYTIHGGCFEDSFAEFRAWLVAQGKELYYKTLEDPEALVNLEPELVNIDWEGIKAIPGEVYKELTGQKISSTFVENRKLKGVEWEEFTNDLKERMPKLWVKYNPVKR